VVLLEANPYFWGSKAVASSDQAALASQGGLTFETFFQHVRFEDFQFNLQFAAIHPFLTTRIFVVVVVVVVVV
jgi:hypothetical protein